MKNLYYTIVPYNWRPKNIWYALKCRFWKKYTTIKPRWLGHTWCDKTELIPQLMFECLCQFVEKEKALDCHIDWDSDELHRHAASEIKLLYEWWNEVYLPWFQHENGSEKYNGPQTPDIIIIDAAWAIINKHNPDLVFGDENELSEEAKEETRKGFRTINLVEEAMNIELRENCIRIINILGFLWT